MEVIPVNLLPVNCGYDCGYGPGRRSQGAFENKEVNAFVDVAIL
jgi:hypothetical protein